MGDVWFSELRKAQSLTRSVEEGLSESVSARDAVLYRGKLRQAHAVGLQLQQSLSTISDPTDSERRSTLVADLLALISSLTRKLNGDDDEGGEGGFEEAVKRQDRGLDRLHTSIVGLKEVGSEISAEIEAQTRLLDDIDGQAGGMDLEQQKLFSKYRTVNSSTASTCTLYLLIILLVFLVITTVVNI